MISNSKIILTDVDGVLLVWSRTFDYWMHKRGYVKGDPISYFGADTYNIIDDEFLKKIIEFNESDNISSLPPFRDSIKYVKKLHEECGYVLHCITAISAEDRIKKMRLENLHKLFGNTVIEKLECVGTRGSKIDALSKYKDSGLPWIEDHYDNARLGLDLGLSSFLMSHTYNEEYDDPDMTRVQNWKEIYDALV